MRRGLSTLTATGLYVGAVLGPGLLVTPSLVAEKAGPAAVVAWGALLALSLPLAITFAALGVRNPVAGGTAAYVTDAFGAHLGRACGGLFLAGVVVGAPVVAYAGGRYIATIAGVGTAGAAAIAAAIVLVVVALNAAGLRLAARVQVLLAAGLALLLVAAVAAGLPHAHRDSWTPFAPHGLGGVGSAAAVLMFSFIGWEAVASLVGELRDPARQLPRAIGCAFVVVTLLYAGVAVTTIGVLGTSDPSPAPIAELMRIGLGDGGRIAAVVLAAALTLGTMTTYVAGALKLAGALAPPGHALGRPGSGLLVLCAATAVALALLATGGLGVDAVTRGSSAAFTGVYVLTTAAAVRVLRGGARVAAGVSLVATSALLVLTGVAALVPLAVVALALGGRIRARDDDRRPPQRRALRAGSRP